MKDQFSARSPFWELLFVLQAVAAFALFIYANPADAAGNVDIFALTTPWSVRVLACTVIITATLFRVVIHRYNVAHPNDPVTVSCIFTPEIPKSNERLRSIVTRAMRNVYLYHTVALPIVMVIIVLGQPTALITLILVGLLMVGHYVAYWIGIAPALNESSLQ